MTRPETVNGSGGLTGILVPASRRAWTLLSVCSSWSFRRCVAAAMLAVLGAGEYRGEIDIIFIYSPEASSGVGRARGGTVGGMSSGSTRWLVDYLLVGRMEAEGC